MNRREAGFTIIELIVAMLLFAIILGAVFSVTSTTMSLYRADQARIGVNRNARSTYDLIGNDVRETGERLSTDFPAIVVSQDVSSNSVLTLRRGIADYALPLCAPVSAGATTLYVNANNPSKTTFVDGSSNLPPGCTASAQDLTSFDTQITAGNKVGYIYDVLSGIGNWITVSGTTTTNTGGSGTTQTLSISGLNSSFDPRRTSVSDPTGRDIRIYLLEERKYALSGGTLTMALNNGSANIATPSVQKFLAQPFLKGNPPTAAAYPFPSGNIGGRAVTWRDVAYIDLTLTLSEQHGGKTVQRTVTERYNPRNSLSGQ